jgi:tRNA threonylcarbamoyladenosine biosynthesis protein TsaE
VRESVVATKSWQSATPADTEALGAKLAAAIIKARGERLRALEAGSDASLRPVATRPAPSKASATPSDATGSTLLGATSPDTLVVVYLTGDLGAGKTTLARGFLHAVGITDPIRSPTYTLLETYEARDLTIAHLDLYRLRDPAELEPLGLRDLARPSYVWLIEWAERGAGWLPPPDLEVRLVVETEGHRIDARGVSAFGAACLSRITA